MGERQELEAIVAVVQPSARRIALVLCRDPVEADDLTQDAILRLIRRPPKPLTQEVARAWLRTAITRLFLSGKRRLARETKAFIRLHAHASEAAAPDARRPSDDVMRALERLSPKQRACVVLRYLEDLSEHDVARALGMRHGTVKAHLAKARARLRDALADPNETGEAEDLTLPAPGGVRTEEGPRTPRGVR